MSITKTEHLPRLAEDFLQFCLMNEDLSKKTISEYALDLRVFFRFMKQQRDLVSPPTAFDDIPVDDIDTDFIKYINRQDIMDYIEYLRMERVSYAGTARETVGLASTSTRRKIACVRSFFEYLCVHRAVIESDPTKGVVMPKRGRQLPKYLTLEESQALLKAISGRDEERNYAIVLLALTSGLRVSEIVGINLNDLRISDGEGILLVRGKGNKERQVYLPENCVDAIEDYVEIREVTYKPDEVAKNALFLSRKHHRISVDSVQLFLKKTCQKAGITTISPHKLRHTSATLMLQNGVDVRTIMDVLGHSSLSTTQRYTHVANDELRLASHANPASHIEKT